MTQQPTTPGDDRQESQPVETVSDWLAANLGYHAMAPLTGTDSRALRAATEIIELYSYHQRQSVLDAFCLVVCTMQGTTRELAYHAIAKVMNWSDRERIWQMAGLPPLRAERVCAFEPGGCHQDMREEDDVA
jgi:hypothetical protein